MKKLLNYNDFQNQKISEKKSENAEVKDVIEDHTNKVVEITANGFIATNQDGEKTIVDNKDTDYSIPTRIEEVNKI